MSVTPSGPSWALSGDAVGDGGGGRVASVRRCSSHPTVPHPTPHHPVRLANAEQPPGAVVPLRLHLPREAGHPARVHGAVLSAHHHGGLLQCLPSAGNVRPGGIPDGEDAGWLF